MYESCRAPVLNAIEPNGNLKERLKENSKFFVSLLAPNWVASLSKSDMKAALAFALIPKNCVAARTSTAEPPEKSLYASTVPEAPSSERFRPIVA